MKKLDTACYMYLAILVILMGELIFIPSISLMQSNTLNQSVSSDRIPCDSSSGIMPLETVSTKIFADGQEISLNTNGL